MINKILFALSIFVILSNAWGSDKIELQLKRKHSFEYAGYYAAIEKGFYSKYDLDVEIHELSHKRFDPQFEVITGRAQYAVGDASIILTRQNGFPLVALAAIFQNSPLVLLTRDINLDEGFTQLYGKTIVLKEEAYEIDMMLQTEKTDISKINIVSYDGDLADFSDGKVNGISALAFYEPYLLKKAGISFQAFSPSTYGINFYNGILFTSDKEITNHPERAENFRKASLEGWEYAIRNPDEICALILKKYAKEPYITKDFLNFQAKEMIEKYMGINSVDIGYMNVKRWKHILKQYTEGGFGIKNTSINWNEFIYSPDSTFLSIRVTRTFVLAVIFIVILLLLLCITLYFYFSLKRSLKLINQISGIIPICSCCKKIRNDKGYWDKVEDYIREHSEADFTHSICPTCMEELYGIKSEKKIE